MDSFKPRPSMENQKSKPLSSTKQLQFHVANVYSQIAQMLQQKQELQIQMPEDVSTAIQRVNLIKSVLAYLLDEHKSQSRTNKPSPQDHMDEQQSTIFSCKDCQNYEKNLQKLQNQVRNHIRTHQQLKLYQDGLEEKIEEYKKQKKQIEKKYDAIKKKYEEMKNNVSAHTERMSKYENQNEKLKSELKNFRSGNKNEDHGKRLNRYESNKENLNDWRNHNKHDRTSVDRRNQSTERMRVSVNVKSTKGIPISSKIIQEKHRDEHHKDKQRTLKNRIGYGY